MLWIISNCEHNIPWGFLPNKRSNKKVPSIQGWKATQFPEVSLQNAVSSTNHMLLCFQSFHTLNLEKYKKWVQKTIVTMTCRLMIWDILNIKYPRHITKTLTPDMQTSGPWCMLCVFAEKLPMILTRAGASLKMVEPFDVTDNYFLICDVRDKLHKIMAILTDS